MIKVIDLIVSMAADSADIFAHPQREREKFEQLHRAAQTALDAALNEGYSMVSATPAAYSGSTSIIYVLHKAPAPSAAPTRSAADQIAQIIQMAAGRTKNSASPMWRCTCSDGTRVNVFKHADADKNNFVLFEAAGYAPEMEQLKDGAVIYWKTSPIIITLKKAGNFWDVVQVQPRPDAAKPDPVLPDEIPF